MKWDALDPTHGTHNWGPAGELAAFAHANHQLVLGPTLVLLNQLPA